MYRTAHAWINGGSTSFGFLSGAAGPFAGFYRSIAGAGVVNWLFMIGLLGIAVALLLGIGVLVADYHNPQSEQDEIIGAGRLIKAHGANEAEFALLSPTSSSARDWVPNCGVG